jgi:DNA-binding transcriptional MerR regulator
MEVIMNELVKIKDVSTRYDVTTRTLRYYEKMGLIKSSRCESSGYRLYDETALVRLKQILILRKMNISIADIREIFDANNSDAVLSALDRKVDDIDSEVALLHELKEIVLEFIRQIRQADFHNDADVKMLFDKAMEIETSLTKNNDSIGRLLDTSDVLDEQLTSVVIESPPGGTPVKLDKFEIVKREPCKFVGKSVYAREHGKGSNELFKYFREQNKWVFDELDTLKEYATVEIYNAALKTWDLYNPESHSCHDLTYAQNCLVGYHIGRFMKTDCPVPEGMDAIEIPETYIAKGWAQSDPRDSIFYFPKLEVVFNTLEQESAKQGYELTAWILMADIFSQPDENGVSHFGQYCSCRPKS